MSAGLVLTQPESGVLSSATDVRDVDVKILTQRVPEICLLKGNLHFFSH